ncbi:MAG: nucleoside deaminase [Candidatus ainarchaeum sp.]|nr:nucleoside deaminase [Candidatus ainarchaeum sp.]
MKAERRFMEMAIAKALEGVKKKNSPFGSCIAKDGRVVAVAHNTVLTKKDATNHAEMNAIRLACKKLKSHELRGCTVYSTTEPCPMCFSAIHWAKAGAIVFGTRTSDVKKIGFHELTISDVTLKREGRSPVRVQGGFMKKECMELLRAWKKGRGKTY